MQLKAPPRNPALMREVREQKLKTFIAAALDAQSASCGEAILLLTRSTDSVVMRTVLGMSARLAELKCATRIAITTDAAHPSLALPTEAQSLSAEIRVGTDSRLLDAHEQLIIGDRAIWFGDCMRREPDKIDSFERFIPDDLVANRNGRAAFQKLWRTLRPSNVIGSANTARSALALSLSGVSAVDVAETLGSWQPLTRH